MDRIASSDGGSNDRDGISKQAELTVEFGGLTLLFVRR